ncbi:hypothetical protein [Microcystis aeruginosa]|uniref:hypothetical protein n=1 Tax=Microcystis aeruginosa TaxID=1126 RepID=UPI000B1C0C23|nr:hypothetical protein [Microcystis aeruginosa]
MTTQATVIQGTAREIREALALIPDDEIVRLMVGRPSLSIRPLQKFISQSQQGREAD